MRFWPCLVVYHEEINLASDFGSRSDLVDTPIVGKPRIDRRPTARGGSSNSCFVSQILPFERIQTRHSLISRSSVGRSWSAQAIFMPPGRAVVRISCLYRILLLSFQALRYGRFTESSTHQTSGKCFTCSHYPTYLGAMDHNATRPLRFTPPRMPRLEALSQSLASCRSFWVHRSRSR